MSGGSRQQRSSTATVQTEPTRPEDLAAIEGSVVNGLTGEPLSKAVITLRPTDGGAQGRFGGPMGDISSARSYTARTDSGGRFTVTGVEPGKYRISITRNGFVDQEYGATDYLRYGPPVTLAARQQLRDLTIKMTPNAVITGRIVDEDGEAMAGLQVEAMRYRYTQGKKVLSSYKSATTNDLGEYRIYGLPPGRYLISVAGRRGFRPGMPRQEDPDDYVTTFFAGVIDPASATPLEVGPGQQTNADLRMRRQHTVSVKGRVTDASENEGRRPAVMLASRSMGFSNSSMRPATVDANGNFEIRGVAPGSYMLIAMSPQRGRAAVARLPVDVGNSNVESLSIQISPSMQLTGRVRLESQDPVNAGSVQLRLSLRDPVGMMGPGTVSAQVKSDGTFTFDRVTADQYTLSVSGLPEGYFVKQARLGDQDALALGVDTRSGAAMPLDILLSPNAGKASGTVIDDQQQTVSSATVVLVPTEPERREQPQFYKTSTTGADGRFTLSNIEPGQYKLYAWRDVESGAYMDPDFLRPVEGRGETVNIKEGANEEVRVRIVQ
jgi:protocatechuate 3,4-dioxygenase beta subunit